MPLFQKKLTFNGKQYLDRTSAWSTGLDKELLLKTKNKNWPGKNVMGKILTELRENLKQTKGDKRLTRLQEHVQHPGGVSDTDSEYDTS